MESERNILQLSEQLFEVNLFIVSELFDRLVVSTFSNGS